MVCLTGVCLHLGSVNRCRASFNDGMQRKL